MRDPDTFDGGQPTCYGELLDLAEYLESTGHTVDLQDKHQTWLRASKDGRTFIFDIQDDSTMGKAKRPWLKVVPDGR
jgi:hypothetical protein